MSADCGFGYVWGVKECMGQSYRDAGAVCLWCEKLKRLHHEDNAGAERLRLQWLGIIERHDRMCRIWADKY